jgi:hypothetical protein
MEEIRIIDFDHFHSEDFDELDIRTKTKTGEEFSDPIDDQSGFYLKIRAESDEIVGATIFYADNWFATLAAAFARRDLDHPDVRFFFEQKIKVLGECWRAEQQSAAANAATESATPAEV